MGSTWERLLKYCQLSKGKKMLKYRADLFYGTKVIEIALLSLYRNLKNSKKASLLAENHHDRSLKIKVIRGMLKVSNEYCIS
jgi:hypothetical protein